MTGNATIGALKVMLGLDSAEFTKGLSKAQAQLNSAGKKIEKLGSKIAGVGAVMSVGVTAPVLALGAASIQAAQESQAAFGQVSAALKSMGDASGRSAEQLQASAAELQKMSTFDDDDILRKVTANLLTFGNVSGESFDRAQRAAVDLSARLGQDLQSSAIQVGKALNDPVKGVTALARVGVSFTEQQKEQIKAMTAAGDVAGAQALILGELEKQFGGSAKALRDATPGADLTDQWREFQEVIGAVALKVLPPLTALLTDLLAAFNNLSPGMQTTVIAGAAVAAAIGPVVTVIGGLVTAAGVLLPALGAVAGFMTATLIPAAIATAPVWLPIALAVGAVGVAIAGLIKFWPQITAFATGVATAARAMASAVVDSAKALFTGVKTWLQDKLGAVMSWVTDKAKAVGDAFFKLYDRVVGHSYVPDLVKGVDKWFGKLDRVMVKPGLAATAAVGDAFQTLETIALPELKNIAVPDVDITLEVTPESYAEATSLIDRFGAHARRVADGIADAFDRGAFAVRDLKDSIKSGDWVNAARSIGTVFSSIQGGFAQGGIQGTAAVAGAIGSAIGGTAGAAITGAAAGAVSAIGAAGAAVQLGLIAATGPLAPIAAVGALLGGALGLFGSSKAKKKAKAEAAQAAAEKEAERLQNVANERRALEIQLMQLQGDAEGALAASRRAELDAMDDSNDALQEQVWALQDAAQAAAKAASIADQRRDLEVQIMRLTGDEVGALAVERERELAALDESNRGLQQTIYNLADLAAAHEVAAEAAAKAADVTEAAREQLRNAYDREAGALSATIDKFQAFADSLHEFRRSLDDSDTGAGSYDRAGQEFRRVAALAQLGNADALGSLQGVSERYLAVSKDTAQTAEEYAADLRTVKGAVTAAEATAGRQVSVAQQQLNTLTQSLAGLLNLDISVLTVRDAVVGLNTALVAQIGSLQQMVSSSAASASSTSAEIAELRNQLNVIAMNTGVSASLADEWNEVGLPTVAAG